MSSAGDLTAAAPSTNGRKPKSSKQQAAKASSKADELPRWLDDTVDLFDFDCNVTHPEFKGQEDALVQCARRVRVTQMLVPGSTIEESHECLALARQHPSTVFPTAGVHPYNATKPFDAEEFATLSVLAANTEIVAVGECGLDYSDGFPSPDLQLSWFGPQLSLAVSLQKPLFLHERLAHEPFLDALTPHLDNLPPACVHCFTGTTDEAQVYIKMGFYIGITGFVCKEPHGAALQSMLAAGILPLDRLVVETDAPYMGFPGCRGFESTGGKRQFPNVPTSLPKVVQAIADCVGVSPAEVARITTRNARQFLRL
ncbi:hypothetical protein H310_12780 [Aphanomyces invadans]|uniref:TatD family hydrolase n=1 Tax=Aphanomyces invadans TaxID=157072 RepID=A0A024TGJ1_9STRA|nr:hypothetical protein H310_12780 [Aphanomyces invadans]ETV93173.1 hypothetical protein H310_12780 [Aphanomyces invadans]RHY29353.1 hypothetical protein DYB32_005209 [Aphanomyces invadans]|eukprot:XP_008878195.1 hypothetical protein H310_12780 [Aphanomyces invadans]